ncbi:MAG TPA: aminoglycoside phosphotransferase family protein [Usitatibacter sp.]|nr:aminoglycoside phosphotransferase family protein [Usitatibacter sp.]
MDRDLVRKLIGSQFPQWAHLAVTPVPVGGWDHRSFRLGDTMVVRLPSAAAYAAQVAKEQRWLPTLAPSLPLAIPEPLALGTPGEGYPFPWSVYRWLEGETAAPANVRDPQGFAAALARFLGALQRIDPHGGPSPGTHNFHRGGALATYDAETREAIRRLSASIDARAATNLWDAALRTTWQRDPMWVHGDVSAGNLLVRDGELAAVIDFGLLAVGDPACDLAMAWTFMDPGSRAVFRSGLQPDPDTWLRGRAWALWKAAIVTAGMVDTHAVEKAHARRTLEAALPRD